MQPLRSPLRRLGLWLVVPLLGFCAFDLARVIAQRTPREVQADQYVAPYTHEYVRVIGLLHLEETLSYEVINPHDGDRAVFGKRMNVAPYALVPLNRPERSNGRVMLAEVPLVNDELPSELLDGYRFEYTGLAGPLPNDLVSLFASKFPPGTVFSRLRVGRGQPSLVTPVTWFSCIALLAIVLRWLVLRYERSDDARRGFPQRISRAVLVMGLVPLAAVVWTRLRSEPAADGRLPPLLAFGFLFLFLLMAQMPRGRQLPGFDRLRHEDPDEDRELLQATWLESRILDGYEQAYEEDESSPLKPSGS